MGSSQTEAGVMSHIVDAVIIGAGPYGLSHAAHLAEMGVDLRVFGSPMHTWRTSMPEAMVLKSEGFASSLYDPRGEYPLSRYCAEQRIEYQDIGLPIPLQTFINYGIAFQRRYVPNLEERTVLNVEQAGFGFTLQLDDGEVVRARRVIVAAGIRSYEWLPPELDPLPRELVTHSAAHRHVDRFAGKEVVVVGAGASAINLVALLHQAGAAVTVVARRNRIAYCGPPTERTWLERLEAPLSGLGTGWRSWAASAMPMVFYRMPEAFRLLVVQKHLGPAPGWTLRDQVDGKVPEILGVQLKSAKEVGGRVRLTLQSPEGTKEITADHVIGGTGYKVDMRRLSFFKAPILEQLRSVEHAPDLSPYFESSIPGLFFVGTAAANNFGPLLRFACGAEFTAPRLTRHLARSLSRRVAPVRALAPAEV